MHHPRSSPCASDPASSRPRVALALAVVLFIVQLPVQAQGGGDDWPYVVVRGDTLIGVTARYLAPPHGWRDLQRHNHVKRPRRLISADGARVRVDISDTGPGISTADQQRLFQRFDRLEADGHAAIEGSGLGLALCKQLVGLMQGQSGVQSQPDVGSIFWIRLPRAEAVNSMPGIDVPHPLTVASTVASTLASTVASTLASTLASAIEPAQARVLYIDDDPVNVLLMEALLAAHWPACFTAPASMPT